MLRNYYFEKVFTIVGPALGHFCGGNNDVVAKPGHSKIRHRYSTHNKIRKARSNPQESHKINCDEFMVEVSNS